MFPKRLSTNQKTQNIKLENNKSKYYRSQNTQILKFSILGHGPHYIKTSQFMCNKKLGAKVTFRAQPKAKGISPPTPVQLVIAKRQ